MVLIGNVDANINTVDTETSINMVDDDMNYLVMAMIKGETNISIDTETTIDMVVDVMNCQVKIIVGRHVSGKWSFEKTSRELRMLSRSLADCQSTIVCSQYLLVSTSVY